MTQVEYERELMKLREDEINILKECAKKIRRVPKEDLFGLCKAQVAFSRVISMFSRKAVELKIKYESSSK